MEGGDGEEAREKQQQQPMATLTTVLVPTGHDGGNAAWKLTEKGAFQKLKASKLTKPFPISKPNAKRLYSLFVCFV